MAISSLHPARQRPRLGNAPRCRQLLDERVQLGPLTVPVGDDQLDQRLACRLVLAPRRKRPEALPERLGEGAVERVQDLGARAEVGLQRCARADPLEAPPALLEQLDVGVAEAIDRLLGVADHEQVEPGDEIDQLELHIVGVLHLIDHDPREALAVAVADLLYLQAARGRAARGPRSRVPSGGA